MSKNEATAKSVKAEKAPKVEKTVQVSIITAKPVAGATVESLDFTAKSTSAALRHAAIKLGVVAAEDVADAYPYELKNKISAKFAADGVFGGVYVTDEGKTEKLVG